MDAFELMETRHSVRVYNDRKIEPESLRQLQVAIEEGNTAGRLHMQLIIDNSDAFGGITEHYGQFRGVRNYIAMIGDKSHTLEERIGYYGEKIVLKATELGLSTCWIAGTYNKSKCAVDLRSGEKLVCVVSVGYADSPGVPHKSKRAEQLYRVKDGTVPDWFERGIAAARLAPTAMNRQRFLFSFDGKTVTAKAFTGFYMKLDLGIVEYHFELGSGRHFKTI